MVLEWFTRLFALFTFLEAAELLWVVFIAWANIVGEQVVVSDFASLLGVVPKPANPS